MPQHRPEKNRQSTRYILAIDLGSGGLKVAIISDSGEVVASADETVTTFLLPDGGAEQDPKEWWNGAKKAAKLVIKKSGIPPENIVAVGCDSQWSMVVPVDEQGEPLMRAVHWLDQRGGPYNQMISGGVIFLPWLNGSLVPSENPNIRGGFMNLSLNTTRSQLTRAVMEGIAYNNRWTRGPAEKFIGQKIERFRFSGGGALSDVWTQIHADVLGVPIHQIDDPIHTTVRGTAFLGFMAMGYRTIEELPELIKIKQVFEPDVSNRAVYDKMYIQYRELFKRNKKVFAALNAG